ncbi:hypothetical protein VIAE108258_05995 [Vibrio aerogenes]
MAEFMSCTNVISQVLTIWQRQAVMGWLSVIRYPLTILNLGCKLMLVVILKLSGMLAITGFCQSSLFIVTELTAVAVLIEYFFQPAQRVTDVLLPAQFTFLTPGQKIIRRILITDGTAIERPFLNQPLFLIIIQLVTLAVFIHQRRQVQLTVVFITQFMAIGMSAKAEKW